MRRRRAGSLWIDLVYPEDLDLDEVADIIMDNIPSVVSKKTIHHGDIKIELLSVYPPNEPSNN